MYLGRLQVPTCCGVARSTLEDMRDKFVLSVAAHILVELMDVGINVITRLWKSSKRLHAVEIIIKIIGSF